VDTEPPLHFPLPHQRSRRGKHVLTPQLTNKRKAFTLLSTLLLTALILVLLAGILSLAGSRIGSGTQLRLRTQAEAHAIAALDEALAQLQEEMGPDQRISAPGSLLDTDPSTAETDGVLLPWLSGVWESWAWSPGTASPDYQGEKSSRFRGWLISALEADRKNPDLAKTGWAGQETVELTGEMSLGPLPENDPRRVKVPLLKTIQGEGREQVEGRMAWAILDENIKARINSPVLEPLNASHIGEQAARLSAGPASGLETVEGFEDFAGNRATLEKVSTFRTLEVSGHGLPSDWKSYFHDLSTVSSGFPVNVRDGGLKNDLSLALGGALLPPSLDGERIHTHSETAPSWNYVFSYANLWRQATGSNFQFKARGLPFDPSVQAPQIGPEHPVLPVLSRIQFIKSMYPMHHGGWNNWYPGHKHLMFMLYDPVVTLWNPYNVPISFEEYRVSCYQLPLTFRYRQNGIDVPGDWVHFVEEWYPSAINHAGGNAGGLRFKNFNVFVQPESGGKIVLQPGESKVFSPRGIFWDYHNSTTGSVITKPGFEYTGGFALDWIAPRWTRVLYVNPIDKPADFFSVSVQPNATRPYIPALNTAATNTDLSTKPWDFYVNTFIKVDGSERPAGGVRFRYGNKLASLLIDEELYPDGYLVAGIDTPEVQLTVERRKTPYMMFTMQLRTEQDSRFPIRLWDQEDPRTPFFSTADDGDDPDYSDHPSRHLYELNLRGMSSFEDIPNVDVTPGGQGFFGPGEFSNRGLTNVVFASLPLSPPVALTDLRHAGLAHDGKGTRQARTIGNSNAHPVIPLPSVTLEEDSIDYVDNRYLLNDALWDQWYFSGFSEQNSPTFSSTKNRIKVVEDFLKGTDSLSDTRFTPYHGTYSVNEILDRLFKDGNDTDGSIASVVPEGPTWHERSAAHQLISGMFNVNSTSVAAWTALLSGLNEESIAILKTGQASPIMDADESSGVPVTALPLPNEGAFENTGTEDSKWRGYRRLQASEIKTLAETIVEEIKARGPFLSLSEFINRRIADDPLGESGAIETAIRKSGINDSAFQPTSIDITDGDVANYQYAAPSAGTGYSGHGAPGFVQQADLLAPVANILSVRSETFTIRTYGDVRNKEGVITAKAWAEAVVQRVPDWVNPDDEAYESPTHADNQNFGRKFRVIKFRWLQPDEL
jgi:type II secretory pathway pseudopilin PulG